MRVCTAGTALLVLLVAVYCHAGSGHTPQGVLGTEFNRKLSLEMRDRQSRNLKNSTTDNCPCSTDYKPVCGTDGYTYDNACFANCYKVGFVVGECPDYASVTGGAAQLYQQCGGKSPNGPSPQEDRAVLACEAGSKCYRQNQWYWQCLDEDPCDTPGWSCSAAAPAELYQQCGGKGPGGPEPREDNCARACSDGQCYRQNEWYWQCLLEDPCDTPGWNCRNDAKCPSAPPSPSPSPGGGPSPPPSPPPCPDGQICLAPGIYFKGDAKVELPQLDEFEKCGNEVPFYGIDMCKTGLRCTRKDIRYMQCMKKIEDALYNELAPGAKCGDKQPYDLKDLVACPKNTACVNDKADLSGKWTCLNEFSSNDGYIQDKLVNPDQCYSPSATKACPSPQLCFVKDQFYGGCVKYAVWKQLAENDQCGDDKGPYSGGAAGFGNSFCPVDTPCVPEEGYDDSTGGITPSKWICSKREVQLNPGVKCGDEDGPYNGYYTCSSTGLSQDKSAYNLCVQDTTDTSNWRCNEVRDDSSYFKFVEDDGVCGSKDGPYNDASILCKGDTSSCYIENGITGSYKCKASCPADWDCTLVTYLPLLDNKFNYCGPFSENDAWATLFPGLVSSCPDGQSCILKDALGTYQCVPLSDAPPSTPGTPSPPPTTLAPNVFRKSDVRPEWGVLGEFDKCGNEQPYFNVDLCKPGFRCTRKDKLYMQCMTKPEVGGYVELAAGAKCGTKGPYDTAEFKDSACAKGTPCLNEKEDGSGKWRCAGSGFYEQKLVNPDQCYAPGDGSKACGAPKICWLRDEYYGSCSGDLGWKDLKDGDQCGDEKGPYSGGADKYGKSFCPLDKPCVVGDEGFADSSGGITPKKWVCSGADVDLKEGVRCGDSTGPYNGFFTCSTTGFTDGDSYNLCVQKADVADDWRCKAVKSTGGDLKLVPEGGVCGTKAGMYGDPLQFCEGAKASCYIQDASAGVYKCKEKCPSGWGCGNYAYVPLIADKFNYCGPFSENQAWASAFPGVLKTCPSGSYCMLKDNLGIFQCVPLTSGP